MLCEGTFHCPSRVAKGHSSRLDRLNLSSRWPVQDVSHLLPTDELLSNYFFGFRKAKPKPNPKLSVFISPGYQIAYFPDELGGEL